MTYKTSKAFNFSTLKYLFISDEDFLEYYYNQESVTTDAMRFGTALHMLALEPHKYRSNIKVLDRRKSKPDDSKINISPSNNKLVFNLVRYLFKNDTFKYIKSLGFTTEKEVYWKYKDIDCKSKIDIITNSYPVGIIDIKTILDIDCIEHHIAEYKYLYQLAFYAMSLGYDSISTVINKSCICYLLFIEKKSPFRIQLRMVEDHELSICIDTCKSLLDRAIKLINKG